MKQRISITLDEETLIKLKKTVKTNSKFRNQSHLAEMAIKKLIGDKNE